MFCQLLLLLLTTFLSINVYAEKETMIFAIDVVRHGDRTPLNTLPLTSYCWAQGKGQLTSKGVQQLFNLGIQMRERYINDNQLLTSNYRKETVFVWSTDFERTIISAHALLSGLYPLESFHGDPTTVLAHQPIPIHVLPLNEDKYLVSDLHRKKYQLLLKKHVEKKQMWLRKSMELEKNFTKWSELSGTNLSNIHQLISFGDTLYIYRLYHIPLPKDLTEEEADKIINTGQWDLLNAYNSPEVGDIAGCPLFTKIVATLQQARRQKTPVKLMLFLAHDSTILSLMSTMGAPLKIVPPYASDLHFSLFKIGKNKYKVKAIFNGNSIVFPSCNSTACTLTQFSNLKSCPRKVAY